MDGDLFFTTGFDSNLWLISGMFNVSPDFAGWMLTGLIGMGLVVIVLATRWRWRELDAEAKQETRRRSTPIPALQ